MSKWWRGSVPLYICLMISTSLCKLSCWNAFYAKKCMSVSLHSKGKTRTYSLAHCGWIHQLRPVTTVLFYNNLNNLKYLQQIWLHYHRPNQKSDVLKAILRGPKDEMVCLEFCNTIATLCFLQWNQYEEVDKSRQTLTGLKPQQTERHTSSLLYRKYGLFWGWAKVRGLGNSITTVI